MASHSISQRLIRQESTANTDGKRPNTPSKPLSEIKNVLHDGDKRKEITLAELREGIESKYLDDLFSFKLLGHNSLSKNVDRRRSIL